jgi:excisionase family DNA binding protein
MLSLHLSSTQRSNPVAPTLLTPSLPSEADAEVAKESSRVLAAFLSKKNTLRVRLLDDPRKETVALPASAVRLLVRILEETARGNAVTLIPVHAELTTQQAADMLNISRPSLIQLLDEGKIEFRRVGTHRRVRFEALMAYKRAHEAERRAALAELARYDQELGL